jgi:hypothetical protein
MAVAVAVAVGSSEGAGAAGRNCSGSWLGKGRHGLKTKRGWLARRLSIVGLLLNTPQMSHHRAPAPRCMRARGQLLSAHPSRAASQG